MEVLLMSCGTGGGHNSACAAIREELESRGHVCDVLNPYTLEGEGLASTVDNAYIKLVQKIPSAFGAAYKLGDMYRHLPGKSPVYLINRHMAPALESYIAERRFDAIASTHLFPAEILTNIKRRGTLPLPPTYYVATDYVCVPFTEETDCDQYVIPAPDLTEDFVSRGVPAEKILPFGIPVSGRFSCDFDRAAARASLGLDADKKYILLAGGSVGSGHIEEMVEIISSRYAGDVGLVVVCGNNEQLFRRLAEKYASDSVRVLEFTDRMHDYMRACDVFVSKPGGLSSTEAAVSETPLIHVSPIPGCETHNMEFFGSRGMSMPISSPKELPRVCDRLLTDGGADAMRRCQRRYIPHAAARSIAEHIEKSII